MTARLFGLTAAALAAALLSACAAAPPQRLAAAQAPGLALTGAPLDPAPGCGDEGGSFAAPDAVKLPKDAFGGCRAQ